MESAVIAIICVVIVLFVGILIYGFIAAKKRREAFQAYAAGKGWQWSARDDQWCDAFTGAPFGLGHGRQTGNVLTGTFEGRAFTAFDYTYRTTETSTDAEGHTTTSEESHNFCVAAVQVQTRFPALSVAPENFFGRAVGRLTNHDIELESEDFNRAFTVHCEDRKFASDVLNPRLMKDLLNYRDIGWRFDDTWILTVAGRAHNPQQVERSLTAISTVVASIPDFVWQDHGGTSDAPSAG